MRFITHYTLPRLMFALIVVAVSESFSQQTGPALTEQAAMERLKTLGYWVDSSLSPKTAQNKQAIIAFQKTNGLSRTGKLSETVIISTWYATVPIALDSMHQRHIEVDLNRQVLFIVDSTDRVQRILSVSTGSGERFWYPEKGWRTALTPRGHFKIYYKVSGWRKSTLGMLFEPMYVAGGVAIHGAASVPAKPASHGCIRIPLFAATEMSRTSPLGTPVVIYGLNPKHR